MALMFISCARWCSRQVSMAGSGRVCFYRRGTAPTARPSDQVAGQVPEEYAFKLPDLVLHDPMSSQCMLRWKGRLGMSCGNAGAGAEAEAMIAVVSGYNAIGRQATATPSGYVLLLARSCFRFGLFFLCFRLAAFAVCTLQALGSNRKVMGPDVLGVLCADVAWQCSCGCTSCRS